MDLDELAVKYYHDSLALAQKALIAGLTVAGVVYLVTITGESKPSYVIPLIGVEVTSFSYYSVALLILFIACGAVCAYGIHKALDNWKLISDKSLSSRLLEVPSIFLAGIFVDSLLYGFLFMVGANLSETVFGVDDWNILIIGSAIIIPYFYVFSGSSELRQLRKNRDNS